MRTRVSSERARATICQLLEVGRTEGLSRITAEILFENRAMQRIIKKLGFRLRRDVEAGVIKANLDLYQLA